MLLHLQKYNLEVKYKSGNKLYLVDTLSMTTELKDYILKCDAHRKTPGKEPLQQHEFTDHPWSKVGIDLCEFQGRTLVVLVDYHSNFIEVERITKLMISGVSKVLMTMFSRYGVPDQVVSDNGPQLNSGALPHNEDLNTSQHLHATPNQMKR